MTKHVLVASQNQIKLKATAAAFAKYSTETYDLELTDLNISSGVSDQPMSLSETTLGVVNRLKAIQTTNGYDFYVAIEGGVYSVETPLGAKWFESACAVVAKVGGEPCIAYGPAYPVPEKFVRHLQKGLDLNQAMELETGMQKAGSGIGFNGWLTKGKLDRQAASAEAVLLALYGLEDSNHG